MRAIYFFLLPRFNLGLTLTPFFVVQTATFLLAKNAMTYSFHFLVGAASSK